MESLIFANLKFSGLLKTDVFNFNNDIKIIIPTNAEIIVKANENKILKDIISQFILTFDGEVPLRIARLKNKVPITKMSGSDLIYDFCNLAKDNKYRTFLLGGDAEANKKSILVLNNMYNIPIKGYSPPFDSYPFKESINDNIRDRIKLFSPDILFVGFGVPKQEYWIYDNLQFLKEIGIKYVIACGGTYEMVAGFRKRAPKLIQRTGLEGFYRLLIEPKKYRLKRLLISFKMFKYIK